MRAELDPWRQDVVQTELCLSDLVFRPKGRETVEDDPGTQEIQRRSRRR